MGLKYQKRGITERKRAEIENPYRNAHPHINMNARLILRKSFKQSRRSSDNELFLMRTSKGCKSR